MIDAVLIEWEEVLADTAGARRDAMLRALSEEGIQLDAYSYAEHCAGKTATAGATAVLAHLGRVDPSLADLIALRATRAFAERIGKGFTLAPGATKFVERAQAGSRVAVVTSATRSETEFALRLAGIDSAVSTVVSSDDTHDEAPSAGGFELAIEHLARVRPLHRERVVALVASSSAVRAARAAGMRAVAIGTPAHVAIDADGAADSLDGLTLADVARLSGLAAPDKRS
ncbi:MAG: HAD hydrolase-like protein [Gemmatimonadota bacterium]